MRVAVINTGSATVKAARIVLDSGGREIAGRADGSVRVEAGDSPADGIARALGSVGLPEEGVDAIGHRVVHGGSTLHEPALLDETVVAAIDDARLFAPLHNERALAGIRTAEALLPGVPAVAVFDTAFHARRPRASMAYALPASVVERLQLRRTGFHGLAHAALVDAVAAETGRKSEEVDAVTLQLGAGCSACAVRNGRSIETSMGFTPIEGLPMTTRCGDVDPGVIVHLIRDGMSVDRVDDLLRREAGLRGVGGSADVRDLLQWEARGDAAAALALELFVHRLVLVIGGYLTLLEGRGAVVFGGGIGTGSAQIRARVCAGLAAWGVRLDEARNWTGAPGRISPTGARPVYVFRPDEEGRIAREAAAVVATGRSS